MFEEIFEKMGLVISSVKIYSKREKSTPAAELVIASTMYSWYTMMGQCQSGLPHNHMVGSSCITPHLSHLLWGMSQPNWRKLVRKKNKCSVHGDFSVSRAEKQTHLWCWPVLWASGEAVRKTAVARVCVQDSNMLEKLKGLWSHSQISLSGPKLA